MKIIGLLSTQEEAEEIQFVAKICTLQKRIHYITYLEKIKNPIRKKN
ncbi:MAG: hypothetical protein R6V50_04195 [Thermoplasmatota archaeon]